MKWILSSIQFRNTNIVSQIHCSPAYFPSSLTHAKGLGLSEHPVLFPPLLVLVLSTKYLYFRAPFSIILFQTPPSVAFVFYLWVRVKTSRLMRSLNSTLSYTYFKSPSLSRHPKVPHRNKTNSITFKTNKKHADAGMPQSIKIDG